MPILGAKLQTATENDFLIYFFYSRAMTFLNNPNNRCESPPRLAENCDIYDILSYLDLFTAATRQFKGRHYAINTE